MIKVRRAVVADAKFIQAMLRKHALEADLIVKNLNDIYAQLRDYYILEKDGKPAGVIALHVYWEDLGEIRSFIIEKSFRGKGSGKKLFARVMKEAEELGIKKVFVLTKIPGFFRKYGFKKIEMSRLPQKVWKDCLNCPKFPDQCDESALIMNLRPLKKQK
ncbi:MAG TPA: N-acetyltransferase [Firmicutes bacterium]|nr:N-acetyltransferase [Bacillota bacterium]